MPSAQSDAEGSHDVGSGREQALHEHRHRLGVIIQHEQDLDPGLPGIVECAHGQPEASAEELAALHLEVEGHAVTDLDVERSPVNRTERKRVNPLASGELGPELEDRALADVEAERLGIDPGLRQVLRLSEGGQGSLESDGLALV